ncbi:hypothetical protein DFI02_101661 [Rhizobium sp. PP-F2F-G20b]|nr:hypothetical protein DFI02_101661 [Rhizobium sp. PP-F2F-G20b]
MWEAERSFERVPAAIMADFVLQRRSHHPFGDAGYVADFAPVTCHTTLSLHPHSPHNAGRAGFVPMARPQSAIDAGR